MHIERNTGARSRDHCHHEKVTGVKYCVCVSECVSESVALVMQLAKHMRCIVLSSVACPAYHIFADKRNGM